MVMPWFWYLPQKKGVLENIWKMFYLSSNFLDYEIAIEEIHFIRFKCSVKYNHQINSLIVDVLAKHTQTYLFKYIAVSISGTIIASIKEDQLVTLLRHNKSRVLRDCSCLL